MELKSVWVVESGLVDTIGGYLVGVFSTREKAHNYVKQIKEKYHQEDKEFFGPLKETSQDYYENKYEFFSIQSVEIDELQPVTSMNA